MYTSKVKKSQYKCLSKKDKEDLNKWFNHGKKKAKKKKSKKGRDGDKYSEMADLLKGKGYPAFLSSRYWSVVRKRVLSRDRFKCIICGSTENLQVHHCTYKNHYREHENLKDLITLCRGCHQEHHYAQK